METSDARIVAVHGNRAIVSINAASACPRCAAGQGCGAGLFTGPVRSREIEVAAGSDLRLAVGDQVILSLRDMDLLRAACFAYGLPLAGPLVALAVAWLAWGPLTDAAAVGIASAGLIIGWIGGRFVLQGDRSALRFQPEIVVSRKPLA
jgi:sigma-E factor negative regulatory protein RseC